MITRKLFQSPTFLFSFSLISFLLLIIHYYSKYHSLNTIYTTSNNNNNNNNNKNTYENIPTKIFEINDREPTFKLATYDGYKFPLERNRAQTTLITSLQLRQRCQKNPNTTVVDIGASLGGFGFYAAACGCQVYMFEIEPKKLSLIKKSIKLNSFESRIHLIAKAVSDLKANTTVYFSRNTSSQLSDSNDININNPDIYIGETINLNQYSFPSDIYILRVDVQGHELHVFRSAEKLFREYIVHHAIFEYTSWGTTKTVQKDIFGYMKHILGAKKFYALHPKEPSIYGPLDEEDIIEFYSKHNEQRLQRDVYVLFRDEGLIITSTPYTFESSYT